MGVDSVTTMADNAAAAAGVDISALHDDSIPVVETPVEEVSASETEETPEGEESTAEEESAPVEDGQAPPPQNLKGERDRLRAENVALKAQMQEQFGKIQAEMQQLRTMSAHAPAPKPPSEAEIRETAAREVVHELQAAGYSREQLSDPLVRSAIEGRIASKVQEARWTEQQNRFEQVQTYQLTQRNEAEIDQAMAASPVLTEMVKLSPEAKDQLKELVYARWTAHFEQGENAQKAVEWLSRAIDLAAKAKYNKAVVASKAKRAGVNPIGRTSGTAPSLANQSAKAPKFKSIAEAAAAVEKQFGYRSE